MSLKNNLTVIQNFMLSVSKTNVDKKKLLFSNIGLVCTAKTLSDCKWIVNYKSRHDVEIVRALYESNIPDLIFTNRTNSKHFNWAKDVLEMLKDVQTKYVYYLTEDRLFFQTNKDEFEILIDEISSNNVCHMMMSRYWKYSGKDKMKFTGKMSKYIDTFNTFYGFYGKNSPMSVTSIDSVFRKDVLVELLKTLVNSKNASSLGTPHSLESIKNNVPILFPEDLCAVPKDFMVVSDEDIFIKEHTDRIKNVLGREFLNNNRFKKFREMTNKSIIKKYFEELNFAVFDDCSI